MAPVQLTCRRRPPVYLAHCSRRLWCFVCLLLLTAAGCAAQGPAASDPADREDRPLDSALAALPADAPIQVLIRWPALHALGARIAVPMLARAAAQEPPLGRAGRQLAEAVARLRAEMRTRLGADLLSARGWAEIGVDCERPWAAALLRPDPGLQRAVDHWRRLVDGSFREDPTWADALSRMPEQEQGTFYALRTPAVMLHSALLLPLAAPARFERALQRYLGSGDAKQPGSDSLGLHLRTGDLAPAARQLDALSGSIREEQAPRLLRRLADLGVAYLFIQPLPIAPFRRDVWTVRLDGDRARIDDFGLVMGRDDLDYVLEEIAHRLRSEQDTSGPGADAVSATWGAVDPRAGLAALFDFAALARLAGLSGAMRTIAVLSYVDGDRRQAVFRQGIALSRRSGGPAAFERPLLRDLTWTLRAPRPDRLEQQMLVGLTPAGRRAYGASDGHQTRLALGAAADEALAVLHLAPDGEAVYRSALPAHPPPPAAIAEWLREAGPWALLGLVRWWPQIRATLLYHSASEPVRWSRSAATIVLQSLVEPDGVTRPRGWTLLHCPDEAPLLDPWLARLLGPSQPPTDVGKSPAGDAMSRRRIGGLVLEHGRLPLDALNRPELLAVGTESARRLLDGAERFDRVRTEHALELNAALDRLWRQLARLPAVGSDRDLRSLIDWLAGEARRLELKAGPDPARGVLRAAIALDW